MNTASGPGHAGDGWTIIVPVKTLERAKSRLAPELPPGTRRALVVAMATDVITACRNTTRVDKVCVVGSDPEIARIAQVLGAEFVVDPTSTPTAPGAAPDTSRAARPDPLNTALSHAMAGVRGAVGVVAADLPELDSLLLTRILDVAARHPHSVVTDHRGDGTTMAFWTGSTDRVIHFGPGSADRFRHLGGAEDIAVDNAAWGGAARDVDIPEDVAGLDARRVGTATACVLQGVPASLRVRDGAESVTMVR